MTFSQQHFPWSMRAIAIAASLFVLGSALAKTDSTTNLQIEPKQVTNIAPSEALLYVGSGDVYFLDVREPIEYEAGHIPGSFLLPLTSGVLYEEYTELPTDKPIIVYCRSGGRSAVASAFLDEQGFSDIWNMTGGFNTYSALPDALVEIGPYQERSAVDIFEMYQ